MFDLAITMERDEGRCKMGDLDARIIFTDLVGDESLVVAVTHGNEEGLQTRAIDGSCWAGGNPLTTLPETKISYAHLYGSAGSLILPAFGVSRESLEETIDCAGQESLGIYKLSLKGDDFTVEKVDL